MFDRDPCRVDLTELEGVVGHAVEICQRTSMEWVGEYEACVNAVEQSGNQMAWQYVDRLSAKMMETAYELRHHAERLHRLIEERDDFQEKMDLFLKEFYNKK